uniref:Reverse transcriptase Ty1/copia-type domain-containing protein n=1 Tax=Fagus sylvatica TaxID=28930 RepID=A0A2N9HM75_FAGSY
MLTCKPSSTPYSSTTRLTKTQARPLSNPTSFRSLMGALQYLTFTQLDLSFSMNQVLFIVASSFNSGLFVFKLMLMLTRPMTLLTVTLPLAMCLASATAEVFWIRMVLKDLRLFLPNPPLIWCDNLSALALASNLNFFVAYHYNSDAIQVIELLRKSEVEKVGLIGGDHVQHSLRFQDLGLELGDLGIGEVMRSDVGVWPRVMKRENRRRRKEREFSGVP